MAGNRKSWVIAAALIAAGAVADGAAVLLSWQPCLGSMFSGSIFNGYRYDVPFSPECGVAMNAGSPFPLLTFGDGLTLIGTLGTIAALLLAASWLVVVSALPVKWGFKVAAVLPSVFAIAAVAAVAAPPYQVGPELSVAGALGALVEVSAVFALMALYGAGVRGVLFARAVVVLVAATAVGFAHQVVEYYAMIALSDANWDTPPGTGLLTVAFAILAAVVTVILASRPAPRAAVAVG